MKRINILTASAAIAGVPAMLLLQQYLVGTMKTPKPRVNTIFRANEKLMAHTEAGLEYSPLKAHHTVSAAVEYMKKGELQKAENWLKLGAGIHRYPSMMLFYGDYLAQRRRYREALRWYALAGNYGRRAGQHAFAAVAEKKIKALKSAGAVR